MLAVAAITPHPGQPRRHFDEAALDELAASIAARGVIQPVIVTPQGAGRYRLVAGERRWRAAQRAQLHEIPAIIRDLDEREVTALALIENLQREDLNPIEEARAYHRLSEGIDGMGAMTQAEIAKLVDKSRSHVANLQRLLGLPESVIVLVETGKLSMGHARAIINSINPEELAKKIIAKGLNVRDAEEIVRDEKIEKAKRTPVLVRTESRIKFINSEHLVALENQISELCGMDCKISYNGFKGVGKIIMKFDEIEKISQLISGLEK
jgi:ParB family chromosome partitioning protein